MTPRFKDETSFQLEISSTSEPRPGKNLQHLSHQIRPSTCVLYKPRPSVTQRYTLNPPHVDVIDESGGFGVSVWQATPGCGIDCVSA